MSKTRPDGWGSPMARPSLCKQEARMPCPATALWIASRQPAVETARMAAVRHDVLGDARIPSKLVMRVRFSSPAPLHNDGPSQGRFRNAARLLHNSPARSGHYVGHWCGATNWPLEPQLSCLRRDALG